MKQYIIPIFVPHIDYSKDCIFCNEKSISGRTKQVTKDDVRKKIEEHLKNINENSKIEVAFFGGNFTGIDIELQKQLLDVVYEYIQAGKINSIRITAKPNHINKEILKMLKQYKVKTIELEAESTNNFVLEKAGINHTFEDLKRASKIIRRYRFDLGYQMMIGLPESTKQDDINTAKQLIKLRPKMVRIYPVLVMKGTKLEDEYKENKYKPLTIVQAVEICKEIVKLFTAKKIEVTEIGNQITDIMEVSTDKENEVIEGPFHLAFRQLVESSLWYEAIVEKIKKLNVKVLQVEVIVNSIDVNNVIGYKNENIIKLKETYDVDLIVTPDDNIKQGKSKINITKTYKEFAE